MEMPEYTANTWLDAALAVVAQELPPGWAANNVTVTRQAEHGTNATHLTIFALRDDRSEGAVGGSLSITADPPSLLDAIGYLLTRIAVLDAKRPQ